MSLTLPQDFEACGRDEIEPTQVQYAFCDSSRSKGRADLLIVVWSIHLATALGFGGNLSDFRDHYLSTRYPADGQPLMNWETLRSDISTISGHRSLRIEVERLSLLKQEAWIVLRNGQLAFVGYDGSPAERSVFEDTFSAIIESVAIGD
jgi:hypothetical protein